MDIRVGGQGRKTNGKWKLENNRWKVFPPFLFCQTIFPQNTLPITRLNHEHVCFVYTAPKSLWSAKGHWYNIIHYFPAPHLPPGTFDSRTRNCTPKGLLDITKTLFAFPLLQRFSIYYFILSLFQSISVLPRSISQTILLIKIKNFVRNLPRYHNRYYNIHNVFTNRKHG